MEDEMRKPKNSNKETCGIAANPTLANNQNNSLAMPTKTCNSYALFN